MLTALALAAIRRYQRYLSPRKGFACAYRVIGGGQNCSAYGYRVIARCGLWRGWRLLRRRLDACARLQQCRQATPARLAHAYGRRQAGSCDPGCAGPDLSTCADVAECGCDLAEWKKSAPYRKSRACVARTCHGDWWRAMWPGRHRRDERR